MNVLDLGGGKRQPFTYDQWKMKPEWFPHGRHFSEEAEGDATCRRVQPCPLTKKTLLGWMLGWCDDFSDSRIWVSICILVSDLRFKAARWKPKIAREGIWKSCFYTWGKVGLSMHTGAMETDKGNISWRLETTWQERPSPILSSSVASWHLTEKKLRHLLIITRKL